jgi:hypothetical protein
MCATSAPSSCPTVTPTGNNALGVKTLQTLAMGLANRILSRMATKILLSHEASLEHMQPKAGARAVVTGNPIRIAIASRYRPVEFIHDELPDLLAAAELVVGRSGAGMVAEPGPGPGRLPARYRGSGPRRFRPSAAAAPTATRRARRS